MIIIIIIIIGLCVPNQNFTDLSFMKVKFECQNCPPTRCASAADATDSDMDIWSWLI
jgi:hypothetical protein